MLAALTHTKAYAGEVKNSTSGFFDFNFYPYLKDKSNGSVYTLNMGANLPHRLSFFALVSTNNQEDREEFEDTNNYYIEQNIRWQVTEGNPLDLTIQHNMRGGEDNDRLRLGFRWRMNDTSFLQDAFNAIHMKWSINFHVLQLDHTDNEDWQMEHVWRFSFPYLTDRLYLGGFADHTFGDDVKPGHNSHLYLESQFGYRLFNNFYVVSEYRYSEHSEGDPNDLAVGFEYKLKW